MSLLETSLEIRGVTEADAGEYYCNVETYGAPLDQVRFYVPKLNNLASSKVFLLLALTIMSRCTGWMSWWLLQCRLSLVMESLW